MPDSPAPSDGHINTIKQTSLIPNGALSPSSSVGRSGACTPYFSRPASLDGGSSTPVTDGSVLFDDEDTSDIIPIPTKLPLTPMSGISTVHHVSINFSDRPYILVVGGLGYIGSHTTLELAKAGYNVAIVDDMSNSFDSVLQNIRRLAVEHCRSQEPAVPVPDMPFFHINYRDSEAMAAVLKRFVVPSSEKSESRISGVIHFAAFKSVEESISRPIDYYQNNVCGLVELVSLLGRFRIFNFVFSSSATVYGTMANRGRPLREHNMVHHPTRVMIGGDDAARTQASDEGEESEAEEMIIEPGSLGITSPYGRTKYMCEAILADIAHADARWKITLLRYFNPVGCHRSGLLGEHPRQTPTNLVPVLIQVLIGERKKISIFGTDYDTRDGTAVRDFIHVEDLACGHIAAVAAAERRVRLERPEDGKGGPTNGSIKIYNLGTGSGHTVKEVLTSIEAASGRKIPAVEVGRRAGDVGFCVADVSQAERELNWKAIKTLDDSARDVWNYTVKSRGLLNESLSSLTGNSLTIEKAEDIHQVEDEENKMATPSFRLNKPVPSMGSSAIRAEIQV